MTGRPEAPQQTPSHNRKKSVLFGASSGYLSTIVTTALSFITVPLALGYFGTDRYGALVLIYTFAGYLGITGLGIPTAALMLAGRLADRVKQLRVMGKGALLTGGGSLLLLSLVLLMGESDLLLEAIGRVPDGIRGEVRQALFWALVMFLLNLPLPALFNGFIALRKPHLERLYATLGTATYLAALALTVWRQGSLTDLIISRGLLSVLVGVVGGVHFFICCTREEAGLRDTLRQLAQRDREPAHSTRSLLASGSTFLAAGIAMMVIQQTDFLIISHLLGIGAVAPYQVTYRLVTLGFILFTAVTPALLPLYGNAWVEQDHGWIERTANTMLRCSTMLGGLVWIGSMAFAEPIIGVWAGAEAYGGILAVVALGGYGYTLSMASQLFVLLTSRNRIRRIPMIRWTEAGANLLLSVVFVKTFGAGGAALGTWIASLITVGWLLPREIRKEATGVAISYRPVIVHLCGIIVPALAAVTLVNAFVPWPPGRWGINLGIVGLYSLLSIRQVPAANRAMLKVLRLEGSAADTGI